MPELDDSGAPAAGRVGETENHPMSRRSMLKGAAGVGAAGVAATTLAGFVLPASAATRTPARSAKTARSTDDEAAGQAIVVYVRDAAAGEIDVYRGTSEVRLRDRDLAARIVRASR